MIITLTINHNIIIIIITSFNPYIAWKFLHTVLLLLLLFVISNNSNNAISKETLSQTPTNIFKCKVQETPHQHLYH